MRLLLVVGGCLALVACGERRGAHLSTTKADAAVSPVIYVDAALEIDFAKRTVLETDPADEAYTAEACAKAHGVWAEGYRRGVIVVEHKQEGAVPSGKQCWSRRPPTRLSDGGKNCSGQSDCKGNCVAQLGADGKWAPRCQVNAEDDMCGGKIFDGGRYHTVVCPVP